MADPRTDTPVPRPGHVPGHRHRRRWRRESTRSRPGRPRGARAWAAISAVLAAAGIAVIVGQPHATNPGGRLEAPLAPPPTTTPTDPVTARETPGPISATGSMGPSSPIRLQIPALGVTSAVVKLDLDPNGALEVPSGAYPVGWYDRGPTPGQLGPAVLAGHVDWKGNRGAFYRLRELRPGDTVVIDRADGTRATFDVDRVEQHPKDRFPTDEVYGDTEHAGLRLITCGGPFDEHTSNYRDNVIVFATLSGVSRTSQTAR